MREKGLSSNTVYKHHILLHTALKMAHRQKLLPENPIDLVEAPHQQLPSQSYYNPKQLNKLFRAVEGDWLEIVVKLAGYLGLRRSEICGLRWEDVDLENGVIGSMALLHAAPLPSNLVALGVDGINQIWRQMKLRCAGLKRAQRAFEAAQNSVGCTTGIEAARMELQILLEDYDAKLQQYERIMKVVESLCRQIPEVEELLKIKGIGLITVAGIFAEVGDLRRFSSPRQLQKLAGLAITENSSGKHKGQTEISRRGRAHLRAILFRAVMPLVARNEEFQKLHHYLTTRAENPLKKMQSIIAICCKLLRVFYAVATKGCAYSAEKMLADIRRNQPLKAA